MTRREKTDGLAPEKKPELDHYHAACHSASPSASGMERIVGKSMISQASSYREMGEFWNSHDATEFWDQTEPVEFEVSQTMTIWNVRYFVDPTTRLPHIYEHEVTEEEVEDVLFRPGEDLRGEEGTRIAIGQTQSGRYLKVIYAPDPEPGSVFVITAYELQGKALSTYRRRRRGRR